MSKILTPWNSQPQVPVGIDWGNPITRGLCAVFNPAAGYSIELLSRSFSTANQAYVKPTAAKKSGVSWNTTSSYVPSITFAIPNQGNVPISLLTVASLKESTSSGEIWGMGISSTYKTCILKAGSNIKVVQNGNGGGIATGSTVISADVPFVAIATDAYPENSFSLYLNGLLEASSTSGNRLPGCSYCGSQYAGSQRGIDVFIGLGWNRILSAAEIRSLSQNPWQIFQPLQRRIFVPIPSGGLEAIFSDNLDYYSIRGLIDSSVNPNYNIRTFTQTDKSSVFNVRTNTAIDNSVAYVLRNLVLTNVTSGYNVRGNTSLDASANYKIRTTSDNTNVASYSIRAILDSINNASYNLRGIVSSDKSSAFNVRGLAANSLGIVYNLRGSAYSDSLNNYTILSASSVSAAVTAVYNLRNLVNNTTSSSFNINSSVAQSILDEYKVRTSSLSSNSNNYNIRSNVLKDVITNYQINPAVQYVYSDLNCYYNIITSMISPNEVARVKIYPSRLITTYDVERVKRIIA